MKAGNGWPAALRRSPAAQEGTGGFTLLEVLVALAIMAIATTLILQLFSADLRAIARSGDVTSAALRGESRIREIIAEPLTEEKTWSEQTPEGYRLDIAVTEVMKTRTDNLPVKMLEVALTLRWFEGVKERSLRLTTLKMVEKASPRKEVSPSARGESRTGGIGSAAASGRGIVCA